MRHWEGVFTDIQTAFSLLTRFPIPVSAQMDSAVFTKHMARSVWVHPLIGVVIGGLSACLWWSLAILGLPMLMVAALVIGAGLLMTGALHEDGLSDTADGLGGGWDRARKLEIMKDSRIGGYGSAALCVALLAKAGALAALNPNDIFTVLIVTGALSRMHFGIALAYIPMARTTGMAASVGKVPKVAAWLSVLFGFVLALAVAGIIQGLLAFALAVFGAGSLLLFAFRSIGGQTGDILGAAQIFAELAVLAAFSIGG